MIKFFKEHWILIFVLFLLIIMSMPLLYFGNLTKIFSRQNEAPSIDNFVNPPVIGVCFNNFMESRWLKEQEEMLVETKNPVVATQIEVAHNSLTLQIQQITNLINQNIKVLIINPVNSFGLSDVLEEARRKGIKIIQYDELTSGPVDLFIGPDYKAIGRLQVLALLQSVGFGNYLIFRGPIDSNKAESELNGILNIINRRTAYRINFITQVLPNWSAEEAVNKTRAIIARQKLDGILAPNDLIAGEIIEFLKGQNLPLPKVTGAGAEVTARQRILKDEQLITVYYDYQQMARTAIKCAREFLAHKTPIAQNKVNFNGKRIPSFLFPVEPVTKSNIKKFMEQ